MKTQNNTSDALRSPHIPQGYKNSSLGVIPEEWEVKRLGEICNHFKSGLTITSKRISEKGDYPVYGGNGLRGYTDSYTHSGSYVLIGRQGALCGNINYVEGDNYISEHAIAVQPIGNIHWLKYKLDFWNLNRFSESSAQPGLSVEKLVRYKLTLPPLPEQQRIATLLSVWDTAIEKQTQLVTALQTRKRALMQQLLTGKKRLPGFTEKWGKVKLREVLCEHKEKPKSNEEYEIYTSSKNGLMKQTDYYGENRITNRVDADYNVIPLGCITYRSRSDDGLFTFNKNNLGKGLVSGYYPVFSVSKGDIDFVLEFINYFKTKLTKYSIGTSQLVLAFTALSKVIFELPNTAEQTAIASVLTSADKEVTIAEKSLAHMRQQKKGLMQVLLTGKKRLKK